MNRRNEKLDNYESKRDEKETLNNGDMKLSNDQRKKRGRRRKRNVHAYINYGDKRIKEYPSKLRIKFKAFDEQFDLILKQNDNLFSSDFSILEEENIHQNNSVEAGSKLRKKSNSDKNSDKNRIK